MSLSINGQNTTQNTLASYLGRLQELENAAFFLLQSMSISSAFGDLLNKLGSMVGEPRLGRSDVDYKAGIRLKIRVNLSSGRASDIIAVALLAAPSIINYVENYPGPASFTLDLLNLGSAPYVVDKLKHTRAAGTYGLISYTTWSTSQATLILDSQTAGAVTSPGVMDSLSGGVSTPGWMSAGIGV